MQSLLRKIAELLRLAKMSNRWKKAAGILAVVVVFCTTYMLILPAITLETKTYCGMQEHVHSDLCYGLAESASGEDESSASDDKTLICSFTEHTHSDECYTNNELFEFDLLDEEVRQLITDLNSKIASLPTSEEIEDRLIEFEENNDIQGEEAYIRTISKTAYTCYYTYNHIQQLYGAYITDYDKVTDISWLWSAQTFGLNSDGTVSVDVHAVNNVTSANISYHAPYVTYGATAYSLGITNFLYWMGVVIECDSSGNLYVDNIVYSGVAANQKYGLKASSAKGFVLYIWVSDSDYAPVAQNVSIGDSVSVNFNYTTKTSEKSSAIGTVTFGGSVLEDKDNSDQLHVVESADTYDLIRVNLYDYGSNINEKYNSNKEYPGFQQGGGTYGSFTALSAWTLNFGDTVTADILAGTSGVTNSSASAINKMNTTNSANRPSENAMSYLLGDDGCPVLANGLSLNYLFTDGTYAKKQNTDNINGLFIQDKDTGLYHYNSHDNHAQFEADTNTFTLYEEVISPNYMMYPFGNFFPFADIVYDSKRSSDIDGGYLSLIATRAYSKYLGGEAKNDAYDEYLGLYNALTSFVSLMNTSYTTSWSAKDAVNYYFKQSGLKDSSGNYITFANDDLSSIYTLDYDVPSDFYFGMEMEMTFLQPKGGLTGITGEEPLNFYFTGDDDVWIYIDGVLFLDLSGIHRHVGGEIDFVNGKVHYYELLSTTGDVATTPYKTETFAQILERAGMSTDGLNTIGTFADYSTHTLKFFYMERGSGSGVCRMNFNLPLVRDNTITITKQHDIDSENILGNPYYNFQVLKVADDEKTDELFISANTAYEVLDSAGNKIRDAVTDANGLIKIKVGETALIINPDDNVGEYYVRELIDEDFTAQYGQVIVDGKSTTTAIHGIHIGSDYFDSHESEIKDILDGHTDFDFMNSIDTSELGALMLKKELEGSANSNSFDFSINLDGAPLPVGTPYKLIDPDGTQSDKTVTTAGVVSLKAGESVLIEHILAGSEFTVTEDADSKGEYTLLYEENGGYYTSDGDAASGFILPASTLKPIVMTAVNCENGTSITIDGTKTLVNYDSGIYSYDIILQEVTDQSGVTAKDDGTQLTATVELSGEESGSLTENFSFTVNYYDSQLSDGENKYYYLIYENYDESMADNTDFDESAYVAEVTVTKTGDEITAELTALYKDSDVTDKTSVDFENTLVGQLTISKEVTGEADESQLMTEFDFEISMKYNDEPLNGTYSVIKADTDGAEVTDELTFTQGKATVNLRHGQSLIIKGIPVNTQVSVTENTTGFYTSYSVNDSETAITGNTAECVISTGDVSVKFINHVIYVLPETGGTGLTVYIFGGLLICLSAVFLLCYIKKRRERRLEGSRL